MAFQVPQFNTQSADDERLAQLRRQLQQQTAALGRQNQADYASRGLTQSGIPGQIGRAQQSEMIGQIGQAASNLGLQRQQMTETQQSEARQRAFEEFMQRQKYGYEGGLQGQRQQGSMAELQAQLGFQRENLQSQIAEAQRNRDWQSVEALQGRLQELEVQGRQYAQQTGERVGTQQFQGTQADLERQAAREQQQNALNLEYSKLQQQMQQFASTQDWQGYQNAQDRLQQLEVQGRGLQQEQQMEYARQQYGAGMQQLQGQQGLEQQYMGALYGLGAQGLDIGAQDRARREQNMVGMLQGNIGYQQDLGSQVLGYEMQRAQQPYQYQLGQAQQNQQYLQGLAQQSYGGQMQADLEHKQYMNQGGPVGSFASSALGAAIGAYAGGSQQQQPSQGGGTGGAMYGQYGYQPQLQYNPYAQQPLQYDPRQYQNAWGR